MNKFYDNDYKFDLAKPRYESTKLLINDMDTFEAASLYSGQNTCCLSFASSINPGGGYEAVKDLPIKIKSQEEDLFRRSNLPELMSEAVGFYPLERLEGIYTSGVVVTKNSDLSACVSFNTSLVSVPAVISPKPSNVGLVTEKIDRILSIAAENNIDILILGAWGCGVFNNRPDIVAGNFVKFLKEKYWGVFKEVVFAIPNKESYNHIVFKKEII